MTLPRRGFLIGASAAAAITILPAAAKKAVMPPLRLIRTNGINLAIRDIGIGPAVVLLHGFPGLSYSWRYQVPALAAAGYRVIVPDLRGYGGSDAPVAVEAYDIAQLTGDMVGLLNALGLERAVFMGHDWGGLLAWQMAVLHRNRVAGIISVNTPYIPHWMLWLHRDLVDAVVPKGSSFEVNAKVDPIAQMRRVYRPDMYVLMFQDGRLADDAMNTAPRRSLRNSFRKDLITAAQWDELAPEIANMEYYGKPIPAKLPGRDVLSSDELNVYVDGYKKHGFTPPINWYRNISRNWQAGLEKDQIIRVPSLMISAANDIVLRPSMAEDMEAHVADLERHVVADSWHWTPEDNPAEVNRLSIAWLDRRFSGTDRTS